MQVEHVLRPRRLHDIRSCADGGDHVHRSAGQVGQERARLGCVQATKCFK